MKDQERRSSVGCGLEILKDSLFLSSAFHEDDLPQEDDLTLEGRELKDVCALSEDEGTVKGANSTTVSKAFGNLQSEFRQQENIFGSEHCASFRESTQGGFDVSKSHNTPFATVADGHGHSAARIDGSSDGPSLMESGGYRMLRKERSLSTDIYRDEAWERKKDLYHSTIVPGCRRSRAIERSVSDCSARGSTQETRVRTTVRSLTDEDLEELRGCIDLGFGFSDDEGSCDLKSTLPALELYYAINRNYADMTNRSSPVSPLTHTSSGGSPQSPLSDSLKISSPGEHPSRVKVKLRHWAQAVACSIKQGFSP